ncbi:putative membrane protein YGL010W [Pseudacidovorax sp. 1753]|uniref:Mpo1 family 2-hydroxy fatty acid dioxygenase n=1 Tax=Pseudacidovorax sp. 1753 TaxID=3156419 RepID=UPI003393202A
MKTLTEQLSTYAGYHRDPRNIATHFIGIPMIVLAVVVLLSRPGFMLAGLSLTPAVIASLLAMAYYLRLDLRFGAVMAALLALALWFGDWAAALPTARWLTVGVGGFVVGWAFQFVGHWYEGRKPAFVDDLMGLLIGPLFVVAEAAFMLGLCQTLRQAVEQRAGPVRHRVTA